MATEVAPASEPAKKKNFLLNIGEDEDKGWSMNYDWATFEEKQIGQESTENSSKRDSCWHCFRFFPAYQAAVDQLTQRVSS